jgi:hypothetical protein
LAIAGEGAVGVVVGVVMEAHGTAGIPVKIQSGQHLLVAKLLIRVLAKAVAPVATDKMAAAASILKVTMISPIAIPIAEVRTGCSFI